jgi:hypothetical protein
MVGPGGEIATGVGRPQLPAGVAAHRQQLIDVLKTVFPAASHVKAELHHVAVAQSRLVTFSGPRAR